MQQEKKKAWVVTVDMGYGHQRTAYPLRDLTPEGKVINANNYEGIPPEDRRVWETTRGFYEFISDFKRIPLIGDFCFGLFDQFQKIAAFYPKRDLSRPNLSLKQIFSMIKKGWGKHLIEKLKAESGGKPIPLIATFFTPAFMAEHFNYPGEIYCVICDADVARTWAPLNPQKSRIKYFTPNHRTAKRLELYGVKKENIFLTGYPMPKEDIGTEEMEVLRQDLESRLLNLDPKRLYFSRYSGLIRKYLGYLPSKSNHPLTLMFAIGGAGAQKEIAIRVIKSLKKKIRGGEIKIILVAGIKSFVRDYFLEKIEFLGLKNSKNIEILYAEKINDYFEKFNQALRTTDVLWTKPSELSFYVSLGIPIIIAPSIGSQEDFNREWLLWHHAGRTQDNPNYTDEWFFEFLERGEFADMAMHGFIEAEKLGTFKIGKIISKNL
ncbi:hypothetical protein CO074_01770 [bacterium (Candidatus Moisslbacteria) CG_4_9_14_0_8_um_filter_36_20]|nr:MAG: hypothetical protein CO074_01770 [bacterium (Candidatus Moisslbacteria) CG_4_9_14_0_8_um_filter_36_20]